MRKGTDTKSTTFLWYFYLSWVFDSDKNNTDNGKYSRTVNTTFNELSIYKPKVANLSKSTLNLYRLVYFIHLEQLTSDIQRAMSVRKSLRIFVPSSYNTKAKI